MYKSEFSFPDASKSRLKSESSHAWESDNVFRVANAVGVEIGAYEPGSNELQQWQKKIVRSAKLCTNCALIVINLMNPGDCEMQAMPVRI